MKYFIFIALISLFYSCSLEAYVGPGLGVGVIGAIVGVLLSVIMAIIGIFWYPIKRMLKKNTEDEMLEAEETPPVTSAEAEEDE